MDNTELNLGLRENRLNGFWKTLEAIDAGNENILDATVSQLSHDLQPKLGALVFGNPHPKDLLDAIHGDANNQINCLVNNMAIVAGLNPDGIHIDYGINCIQRAILPDFHLVSNGIGDR